MTPGIKLSDLEPKVAGLAQRKHENVADRSAPDNNNDAAYPVIFSLG